MLLAVGRTAFVEENNWLKQCNLTAILADVPLRTVFPQQYSLQLQPSYPSIRAGV